MILKLNNIIIINFDYLLFGKACWKACRSYQENTENFGTTVENLDPVFWVKAFLETENFVYDLMDVLTHE